MQARTVTTMAGGVIVAAAAALGAATIRWKRQGADRAARLTAAPLRDSAPAPLSAAELAGLPAPVVRYFEFALTPGQSLPRTARIEQRGEFAMKPGEWRPMRATQTVRVRPPGFVWDAAITMAPGVHVRVRDSYDGGRAAMKAAVGGLVPVVDQADTPGLAESALLRYLAEAPLIPAALLPRAGVRWDAIDDSTARATLSDAGITVHMDVRFGPSGEIAAIYAQRYRDVEGVGVPTPFQGRWTSYRREAGMMIPSAGEAGWQLPDGPHTYWRASIRAVNFH